MSQDLTWLSGGGEMGKLIRSMDWSQNSLGPIENWPQSLKTAVSLCLSSTFPINIVWGPDHIQIYNDAYRPICGALHPASMGSKFKVLWASALPVVGGAFDRGLEGEGTYIPNQRMFLERYGYLEESFMTFSFSPIRDESGNVGGIFHPISESTEKMLSARRTQVIRDLAIQINKAKTMPEMYQLALEIQPGLELDLPFMAFFEDHTVSFSGLDKDSHLLSAQAWGLETISEPTLVSSLEEKFGQFKSGPYEKAPQQAMVLPIFTPGSDKPLLHLVAGASSAREMDSDYQNFFDLLKNTFTTAVTNIKAYEEEQKRAEALAQIDKAKTAFFSNVSHEFRTPLTLILGPLEDSLQDTDHPLDQTQRQRQEIIHRNATRLLKLVNSLLDFSRIEAGRVEANFEPVDIAQFTTDLASIFRSTIEKEGLNFSIETSPLEEPIYVDREMWEKIILNLLSNAFKFTFKGKIAVKVGSNHEGALIKVSDTGIGVSAEELPRLFERFHRVQGAQSRTYEGTGIGLALVQELIHMHGGTISAESAPGEGTTFTIFLPRGIAHLPQEKILHEKKLQSTSIASAAYLQEAQNWSPTQSMESAEPDSAAPVILLADDNADMRNYVRSILGDHWQVLTANDGDQAYKMALAHKPDLILSDVMMPVTDGFELLKQIRAHAELRSCPFILLSARAGEEAKVEGLSAGADDYLVKPFSAKELISRVASTLKMNVMRFDNSREIQENADKFRTTFAHASVNIAMIDLEGRILEINQAFLTKSGYREDEVVGHHFSEITHPDDIEPNMAALSKVINGETQSTSFEKRYKKKDGTFFWVTTSISPAFGSNGKPLYLIAISQDIEMIKQTEENYQRTATSLLEEKDLREKFVATLTHDLRSPLTAAKISAQIIQKKPDNQENVQNHAARIVSNVRRADQMIEDLLDASRIRAGEKLALEKEDFDLNHMLLETIDNLRTIHGNRIIFKSFNESLIGHWSASYLGRLVENLVNNGIKYGDPHASVTVITKRKGEDALIAVHNEGKPLSLEEQTEMFLPYKRIHSPEALKQRGWGLGLTLVRGVIDSHGGEIKVHSAQGEGTTFNVLLPLRHSNK